MMGETGGRMDPVAETLGEYLEPATRLRDATAIRPIRLHAGDVLWLRRNELGMLVEVWPIPREWVHPQPPAGNYPAEGLMLVMTPQQEGVVPRGFYVDRKDLVTCEFGPPAPPVEPEADAPVTVEAR